MKSKSRKNFMALCIIFIILAISIWNNPSNNKQIYSVKSEEKEINRPFYEDPIIDLRNSANYGPFQTYGTGSYKADTSANCSHFILCGSYDCYLYGHSSTTPLQIYTKSQVLSTYSISGDGEYVALSDVNTYLYFHNKSSSNTMWTYIAEGDIMSLDLSYNGSYLVAGSDVGKIYFFNKTGPTPMWSYTTGGVIYDVAITPDGEYFAVGCTNNKVYLFNRTGTSPMRVYDIDGDGHYIAISDDGDFIVVGERKLPLPTPCNVYLFNSTSSSKMWNYTIGGNVLTVDISSYGDTIVIGGYDHKVYVFDKSNSTPMWNYTTGYLVSSVAISSDGQTIIVGSWDYNAYFFNRTGFLLWKYTHDYYADFVAISRDGRYILTSSNGHSTHLFYWNPPKYFSLTTDATEPDVDGMFNLTWTESIGADNYSIYYSKNPIYDFQEEDLIQDGIEDLQYNLSNLNGYHYYLVVSVNKSGVTKSNNILINIKIPEYIIHINANWTETNNTYSWCTGSGTKNNPYIVENIAVNGYQEATCIFIENTEEYFVIRNCTFTNGRCGIKISNATNFDIINNTVSNIYGKNGTDGLDGTDNNDGTEGITALAIYINDCKNINISSNKIININGGSGGNGGIGKNAYSIAGAGGNGGNALGLMINCSNKIFISTNSFKEIKGGAGGNGGRGYEGVSSLYFSSGGDGGSSGNGGSATCIFIEKSTEFKINENIFFNISGGAGSSGGNGGNGTPQALLGYSANGGDGGKGGNGGQSIAISIENCFNATNFINNISNIYGGLGREGGLGGSGWSGSSGYGDGGNGGNGGIGGTAIGIHIDYSFNITNSNNFIQNIYGGEGGSGKKGGNSGVGDSSIGGKGGDGGKSGLTSGIYNLNSIKINILNNIITNIISMNSGNGSNGGNGGNGNANLNRGTGGNGGNGGNGGISLIVVGIYMKNISDSLYGFNNISIIINGNGGYGGDGGDGGDGVGGEEGKGGNAGNGGNGGLGGISIGICFNNISSTIIEWNNISRIYGGNGSSAGNGGNGGAGGAGGNRGYGGKGGDGGNIIGIYINESKNNEISYNNISLIYDTYGALGGIAGTGIGTLIFGYNGTDIYGNGLFLTNSENNDVIENKIKNDSIGLTLENNSNNNEFTFNIFLNNTIYGVIIFNISSICSDNQFYLNNFSNPEGINAYDNGTNTQWDNTTIGNWWHDYSGFDNNDDNIGDIAYNISGESKSQDNFPIWDDGPETIKPDIVFVSPLFNNTQITQSLCTIKINVTDHHPPTYGNVILYVFNSTYDLLFNDTMEFGSNDQWVYNWNNISSYNQMLCILKVQVFDSALNPNMNWSISMYINVNILYEYGGNGGGGDGGGGGKDEGEFNVINFLVSPIGLVIISGIAGCLIIIYLKKIRYYKSTNKEKERISNL